MYTRLKQLTNFTHVVSKSFIAALSQKIIPASLSRCKLGLALAVLLIAGMPLPSHAAKATNRIHFNAIPNQSISVGAFATSAYPDSETVVRFNSTSTSVCTLSNAVYGGSVTSVTVALVGQGVCTITADASGNVDFNAASQVTQSFTVTPPALTSQSISFGAIGTMTYPGSFGVSATATSGLAVSFSSNTPSVCSISGSTVSLLGIGTCSIVANQAGNGSYSAASAVAQSFSVIAAPLTSQSISFGGIGAQTYPGSFGISASATSGLAVNFSSNTPSVCSVSGSTVSLLGPGTCSIVANQSGNASYSAATSVTQSFSVAAQPLASQSISFPGIASQTYPGSFGLSAWASSGLSVNFASATPSVCSVSGSQVTLQGAGSCTIIASQPGNSSYSAASSVAQSFSVSLPVSSQSINFADPSSTALGVAYGVLSATASSGLPVTFTSNTPSICTVSGSNFVPVSAGTCTIVASQAGNANYSAASSVTKSFQIYANGASYVSEIVPSNMIPGGSYTASITMQNTGTSTWPANSMYLLGTQNEQDNTRWGLKRVSLNASVPPGGQYTFSIPITAPSVPGTYHFQWQMVQEYIQWFGQMSPDFLVTVASANAAPAVSLAVANGPNFISPAAITMTASASDSDGSVSSVKFYNGTALLYTATAAPYTYTWPNVPVGSYSLTAVATDNAGMATTSNTSTVKVIDQNGAGVNFVSVAATTDGQAVPGGTTLDAGIAFTLKALTNDAVKKVELREGGTVLNNIGYTVSYLGENAVNTTRTGTLTAALAIGVHQIYLHVYTAEGYENNSATFTVTVTRINATPTITLQAPATGTVANLPATINLSATAGDVDGSIVKVEYYNGATLLYTATSAPFSFAWNPPVGVYSLTAKATDNDGGSTTTDAIVGRVNANPIVSISVPAIATVAAGATLNASATDSDGSIQKVEFYSDANLLGVGVKNADQYNFQWSNPSTGSFTITAKAYDNDGAVTTSSGAMIAIGGLSGSPSSVNLSATPTNVRVAFGTTANISFSGSSTDSVQVKKLELFKDGGSGYDSSPIQTVNGTSANLALSYVYAAPAGTYRFKLRSTNSSDTVAESIPVLVNVTGSSLLGLINGIRVDAQNHPQLVGWVCQAGVSQALPYQVYLDAPSNVAGGQLLTSGTAGLINESDNAAEQSQCATAGVGHHFSVDLNAYTSQYAGRALFVQAQASSGAENVVLPCEDNNCTMPGSLRIGLTTPNNTDQYNEPATVFMRAQLSGAGPYDEIAFSIDGGQWLAGSPDTAVASYYAIQSGLSARTAPYSVQAKVRQGNTILYSVLNNIVVNPAASVTFTLGSPADGAAFAIGAPAVLSATPSGNTAAIQSVKFYANGNLIGGGVNTDGTWSYNWTNSVAGSYKIQSKAFDGKGALLGQSAAVTITYSSSAGTPMSATLIPVLITPPHLGNYDAGTLPGNLGVGKDGAANYDVAIVVPPGTAGMAPSLSLNYSSGSGTNGLLGLGWSLGGLSSIHRCGMTIAQDNINDRISFEKTDRLCLDGKRLVLANLPLSDDNYWATNAEYRTEIEEFSRISTIIFGDNQRGFKVEAKDGRIMTYGTTDTSYVKAIVGSVNSGTTAPQPVAKSGAQSWALDSIKDRVGNYINFSYEQDATTGEHRPSVVRYGGNGMPAHAAVQFTYETRADAWIKYIDETRADLRSRIVHIKTYIGTDLTGAVSSVGTIVRDYQLTYEQSPTSGRSLLNAVQVCARNIAQGETGTATDCLPATTFAWGKPAQNKTPGFESKGIWQGGPKLTTFLNVYGQNNALNHPDYFAFSDFENHGYVDILEKRISGVGEPIVEYNSIPKGTMQSHYRYFHNTGTGFVEYSYQLDTGEQFIVLDTGDFDGDGVLDLLVTTSGAQSGYAKICLSPLGKSTALAGSTITFTCDPTRPAVGANTSKTLPYVVDIKGDGRSAHYSSNISGVATACIQGVCQNDPFPSNAISKIFIDDGTAEYYQNQSARLNQVVDFAGIGKPYDVRWTRVNLVKYIQDGVELIYSPHYENLQPAVVVNSFNPPGVSAGRRDMASYTYAIYATPPKDTFYLPYLFDKNTEMGGMSTDFNGSGYNSLAFGFLELAWDATNAYYSYTRAEMTLCLSTGRALDCNVRKKYSGDRYLSVRAVGNFIGDGQATILADTLTYEAGRKPRPSGNLQMCRVLGDDTTAGQGVDDSNIVCEPWPGFSVPTVGNAAAMDQLFFLDVMGIGRPQIVQYHSGQFDANNNWQEDGRWEVFAPIDLAVDGQALDRIYQVRNGLGLVDSVEYASGLASGIVTQSGNSGLTYPQRTTPYPGKIVRTLTVGNGMSDTGPIVKRTNYRYEDAATDVAGRGALGFAKVVATDELTNIATAAKYSQIWPLTGMQIGNTVTSGGGVVLSDSVNTPAVMQGSVSGTYFPYMAQTIIVNHDLNGRYIRTKTTTNAYTDGWGNLTEQNVTFDGGQFASKTTTTYRNDSSKWLIGKPGLVTTAKTDLNNVNVTRQVSYEYDGTTGLLSKEVQMPDVPALRVSTTYDRSNNAFGQVYKKQQTWINPIITPLHSAVSDQTRTVNEFSYDTNGRLPVTIKNALGQMETVEYDFATGQKLRSIDPNALPTRWTVNGFGRVLTELHADGTEIHQDQKQCDALCPSGAAVASITDSFNAGVRIQVPKIVYSDNVGHQLRTTSWGFDGRMIEQDQTYDDHGRPYKIYRPSFVGDSVYLDQVREYDDLDRLITTTTYDENGASLQSRTDYNGLQVVNTNAKQQVRVDDQYLTGKVKQVRDARGGIALFEYDAFDNLSKTTGPDGNVITVKYDALGRKTDLIDPDLGAVHYDVDPLGRTWKQTTPNQGSSGIGQQPAITDFDVLDRMVARYENDLESHWLFDGADNGKGIGQLAEAYTYAGGQKDYRRLLSYDNFGRNNQTVQILTDGTYTSTQSFDNWSRLSTQKYQRNSDAIKAFDYRYNNMGYLTQINRGDLVLSEIQIQDAAARTRQVRLGNGLTQRREFNNYTGRLSHAELGNSANLLHLLEGYDYDAIGGVLQRTQYSDGAGFTESFEYDELNRIKTSTLLGNASEAYTYSPSGNILTKGNVAGRYDYPVNSIRPHAVLSIAGIGAFDYDLNGNLRSGGGRSITWTSFDMPKSISKGSFTSSFVYGPEHQRARQCKGRGDSCAGGGNRIIYAGAQEVEIKDGQEAIKTYWPNGLGLEIDQSGKSTSLNWMHADRLGSPVAITDSSGALAETLAYDTWGKRRNVAGNMTNGTTTPDSLDGKIDNRGFTGHEMLDDLDLVHMNGRIYDPLVGRFLSADPLVQDPMNGQSYNRYSYVLNNPTNLTDPTGFRNEEVEAHKRDVQGWIVINVKEQDGGAPQTTTTNGVLPPSAKNTGGSGNFSANTPGKGFWDPHYDPNAYPGSGLVDMAKGAWNGLMSLGDEMRAGTSAVVGLLTGDQKQVSDSVAEMKAAAPGAIMAVVIISGKRGGSAAAGDAAAARAASGAENVNAATALASKLSALESAQTTAASVRVLPDGRIRYYEAERAARTAGPSRGSSYVTEWNPSTGSVRSWNEVYDQAGSVNRVHPKMINGQTVNSQHYPPTARELGGQ